MKKLLNNVVRMFRSWAEANRERDRIDEALGQFTQAVRCRLYEKAAEGYRGWDKQYPAVALRGELYVDAKAVWLWEEDNRLVDIGARAMFLWHRTGSTTVTTMVLPSIIRESR
jgi:hypothetical protein